MHTKQTDLLQFTAVMKEHAYCFSFCSVLTRASHQNFCSRSFSNKNMFANKLIRYYGENQFNQHFIRIFKKQSFSINDKMKGP